MIGEFEIHHIESKIKDKVYKTKFIKLNKDFGGEDSRRNGITPIVFDQLLKSKDLRSKVSYYHDGEVGLFLHFVVHWLEAFYTACKNGHYMSQSFAFSPDLKIHNVVKKEKVPFLKYEHLEEFLKEFFDAERYHH